MAQQDDDESIQSVIVEHLVTPNEMMRTGLLLVNYSKRRIRRARKTSANVNRFKGHFGASPAICCTIYEDLQRHGLVKGGDSTLRWFLVAMHTLRKYPTEVEREAIFDVSLHYGRDKSWAMVENIQALKHWKITWPDDHGGTDKWVMTVDGTHFWLYEIADPEWSQNRKYYSHKFNKAGLNYEIGISLIDNKVLWIAGPFRAGMNDMSVFKEKGLMDRLRLLKKKALGDGGYCGHQQFIVTPNSHDSRQCKKFKARALKRQEKFNGMIKVFESMSGRFRHTPDRHKQCFEAVCVVCQYKIETEQPLFDILVQDVLRDEDGNTVAASVEE